MRPPRSTNECRDVHSPIGSCDDSCGIRISSQGGESFDSTDDLSYSDRVDLSGSRGHQHQLLIWDGVRRDLYSLKPWFRHMRICLYSDHSILAEHRLAHTRETEFNKPDGTRHVSKHSPRHPECLQTPYPTSI